VKSESRLMGITNGNTLRKGLTKQPHKQG
jgi:hypothetical protein